MQERAFCDGARARLQWCVLHYLVPENCTYLRSPATAAKLPSPPNSAESSATNEEAEPSGPVLVAPSDLELPASARRHWQVMDRAISQPPVVTTACVPRTVTDTPPMFGRPATVSAALCMFDSMPPMLARARAQAQAASNKEEAATHTSAIMSFRALGGRALAQACSGKIRPQR